MRTERSVKINVTLHYDLELPKSRNAPLLIAVHGYAAHKRHMLREAKQIAPEGFAIASIEAPYRFWREAKDGSYKPAFGWLTDYKPEESIEIHQEFILKVLEELENEGAIDPSRIFLYGFSQACALNFRFAFTYPKILKGIIGVSGGIPSDLDSNPRYSPSNVQGLYLYGDDDEFYPLDKFRQNEDKICEFIPNINAKRFPATHEITAEMRAEMKSWLKENA